MEGYGLLWLAIALGGWPLLCSAAGCDRVACRLGRRSFLLDLFLLRDLRA